MIQLVPAVDIRGGQCVRLHQGRYSHETVYDADPVATALSWQSHGAARLHIVDLDAARGGSPGRINNLSEIGRICSSLDIPVQVGGGIRTLDDIRSMIARGAERVILGTSAVQNPDLIDEAIRTFSASQIVLGLDTRDGEVRIQGWTTSSGLNAIDFAIDMERRGVQRIIYTDIARDGTMEGPNVEAYSTLGEHLESAYLTDSGGVGSYDDFVALNTLQPHSADSGIVGRSLCEQRIPYQDIWNQEQARALL